MAAILNTITYVYITLVVNSLTDYKGWCQRKVSFLLPVLETEAVSMADREERRFAEVSRESLKLMAESTGVELGDDVAALLAEDVCYRLREAAQVNVARMEVKHE